MAYRLLGSPADAEDAVQETWLRLHRTDTRDIDNPGAWLTTVLTRVCLDMLRARTSRREQPLGVHVAEQDAPRPARRSPLDEAVLVESVERALVIVMNRLTPAERIAFVLHDMFEVPFDDIATMLGRSANACRLLASRARRRVIVDPVASDVDTRAHHDIVTAFLAAAREGDFTALLRLLHPDVTIHADARAVGGTSPITAHGARIVSRHAVTSARLSDFAHPVLVDGGVGAIVAVAHQPYAVMTFTVVDRLITDIRVIADPDELRTLRLAILAP